MIEENETKTYIQRSDDQEDHEDQEDQKIMMCATVLAVARQSEGTAFPYVMLAFALFEWGGGLYFIIGRLHGSIGAIAYHITNLNGCELAVSPTDPALVGGHYAKQYRIMQVVNFIVVSMYMVLDFVLVRKKLGVVALTLVIVPIGIAYLVEFLILNFETSTNSKNPPVLLSGSCALVELNPTKYGYYDSEIAVYWKVFMTVLGI
jgi:hypothetical protein